MLVPQTGDTGSIPVRGTSSLAESERVMAKTTNTYTQCVLTKRFIASTKTTVSWLPTMYAKKGSYLELKQLDGSWENGWRVEEVGTTADAAYVEEHERDYTKQRSASDI
jgi:hypothetical protein